MNVLVVWGSKRGGTEGIARGVAEALQAAGHQTTARPAEAPGAIDGFDAVVVGGALYANRWAPAARRFVRRNARALRRVPTWFFSSGPLDDSARRRAIPPTREVSVLMEQVGALGHQTFGGRLLPDASGFPASAMARKHAGDWRDREQVRDWADEIARALPTAKPGTAVVHPGGSAARLVGHAVLGWALCAVVMFGLLRLVSTTTAIVVHAFAVPAIFAAVARHYFAARGARTPLAAALAFTGIVAGLDLGLVAGLAHQGLAMIGSIAGFWLPLVLIFGVTAAVGVTSAMAPMQPSGVS